VIIVVMKDDVMVVNDKIIEMVVRWPW
jgi:hypothetical protein